MATILKITELTNFSEFEDMKSVWNNILENSRDNDIFLTWEWLSSWWNHFGGKRELRILLARAQDNSEVLAIAPLMYSKYNFIRFGKIAKIEFIGSPQSDYNSFILVKREHESIKCFLNYLKKEYNDWDYLGLNDISESTTSMNLLRNFVLEESEFRLSNIITSICPYIDLPVSIDYFIQGLSGNMRRNLRRRMKRLSEKYHVEVKTHRDFDSLEDAMNAFYELHQKRWESKGEPGVFAEKTLRDFHFDVARHFFEKDWLDLYFLTANGQPIASIYTFDYNKKKYEYLTGFDPEYSKYSIANLLRMHVIKECIQKGLKEYDLMRGNEPYKTSWNTKNRKNFEVRLVRKTLFSIIYDWITKSSTVLLLAKKMGISLSLK